jgi:hypothetical protein
MTIHELAELVAKMRTAQRAYFRTTSHTCLVESKRLEKRVDQAVAEVLEQPLFQFGEKQE